MVQADLKQYLANILLTTTADKKAAVREGKAIEVILRDMGANIHHLNLAYEFINSGHGKIKPTGRFSDKVRNLEDMVFVSVADREMPEPEKKIVLDFANEIKISKTQIKEIMTEAKKRVERFIGK